MGDITLLLQAAHAGDEAARTSLFTQVYDELAAMARARLARESADTHLDAGSLLHEAYLRLVKTASLPNANRAAFFVYAASVMRSVIVDAARERSRGKRGGGVKAVTLLTTDLPPGGKPPEVEALDAALQDLALVDARCHQVVELRYFGGLSVEEIGEALQLSPATVKRDWQKARAFLFHALES